MQLLDLSVAQEYIGALLQGLKLTIGIALTAPVLSLIFAIPVALGRLSSSLLIRVTDRVLR